MKYENGDVVTIKNDLIEGEEYGGEIFTKSMNRFKKKNLKIKECDKEFEYYLLVEGLGYHWTDEMFE